MAEAAPEAGRITDHRITPRGVLPRNAQASLMVALSLGILGVIVLTGNRQPAPRATAMSSAAPMAVDPDRLRDYQDRLRVLDNRARQEANEVRTESLARPSSYGSPAAPHPPDPVQSDRMRREYDSLFASNVVLSRRPDGQSLVAKDAITTSTGLRFAGDGLPAPPSIDQVADAVVRASSRYGQPAAASGANPSAAVGRSTVATEKEASPVDERPVATSAIRAIGPLHRVLEGTMIDTVLTNRLDGSAAAPVNCLVTNPVYSHDGSHVLIPAGLPY
jgi:type IV secretion system protein VirB10